MKFPKEKVRLIQIINSNKKNHEYHSIILLKDDVKEKVEELKDTTIIDDVIISMFHLNRYDDMVIFGEELSKKGYESWGELYYLLLACLGNLDVFYGMSIIKRSNLLMDEKMKEFYSEDGSNYMNIYMSNKLTKVEKLVLILVNFMGGLWIATQSKFVIDKEFLAIRFLEMIDTLYELGNREEIIEELMDKIKMIFFTEV